MPRNADKTRKRILDAAHRQFRRRGYSRVSMDEIAGATKVTKRTLYYHFESKDALLTAVLEAQHLLALAAFRTFGDRLSGSVEAIIDGLFRELAVWAEKPRWAGSGFTRLVIELADLMQLFVQQSRCHAADQPTNHADLDAETALFEEVRNAARALIEAVARYRAGERPAGATLQDRRPK